MRTLLFCSFIIMQFNAFSQADGEVLNYEKTFSIAESGKLKEHTEVSILVKNRNAEDLEEVFISYQKENKIENLKAEILDSRGKTVRKLKKSDVSSGNITGSSEFHGDGFVKKFKLVYLEYPHILKYSYDQDYKEYYFIDWFTPVLDWKTPTRQASITIKCPKDYSLAFKANKIAPPSTSESGNELIYRWESSYQDRIRAEYFSPDKRDLMPYVVIAPKSFQYVTNGDATTWKSYGEWVNSLSFGANNLPQEEISKIKQLVDGKSDTVEIIKTLYHYLQDHTRYVNISLGAGGMLPNNARYVCENKFGDCKALTNYMQSMLEVVGIPSFLADIRANDKTGVIHMDLPAQQFNHVILGVPVKKDTMWLENTSNINPFGYVGTFIQDKTVLIVEESNSRLGKTKRLDEDDVLNTEIFYYPKEGESDHIRMSASYYGKYFEKLLIHINYDLDEDNIKRSFVRFNDFVLTDYEISHEHRDSSFIDLSIDLDVENIYKKYGTDLTCKLPSLQIPSLKTPSERKSPLLISYPKNMLQQVHIPIEKGMKVSSKLNKHIETKFGSMQLTTSIKENELIIEKRFVLKAGKYELEEYPAFYEFLNQVRKEDNRLIPLNQ